jgi:Winged helix-turn helix
MQGFLGHAFLRVREESMPRRSPFVIVLKPAERAELERRAARYTSPYRDVVRARIVLMAALGMENKEIAGRLSLPVQVVSKWRKRFFEERLAGLEERPRGGRPPVFSPRGRG